MDATAALSTEIDTDPTPSVAGGGAPALSEPADTARDAVEAAFKEADEAEKAPKADVKPEVKADEKPEPKADAKVDDKAQAKAEEDKADAGEKPEEIAAAKEGEKPEEKEAKGRHPDAPANFLPRAKELWRNVPNEVKADVTRITREFEEQIATSREVTQRYEAIRPYDELARQNGRAGIHESLEEVRQLEDMMRQNPVAALNSILMRAGPRKADGQPVSLFEMASHIVSQGQQGYQQMVQHQPRQQQQNPEVEQLRERLAQMEVQQAAKEIIAPFAAKHPRYEELQPDIAMFLESGKIPTSLSAPERLAAAYDMAERINPSSRVTAADNDAPASERRADDFGGSTKSIRSSPGSVSEDVDSVAVSNETTDESIRKELRRMTR